MKAFQGFSSQEQDHGQQEQQERKPERNPRKRALPKRNHCDPERAAAHENNHSCARKIQDDGRNEKAERHEPDEPAFSSVTNVIHGCGVMVIGREIAKSLISALRHAGRKNQRAGRKAIAAKQISATKMQFVARPSEARGGRTSRYNPSNAAMIPSAHFCEPPP